MNEAPSENIFGKSLRVDEGKAGFVRDVCRRVAERLLLKSSGLVSENEQTLRRILREIHPPGFWNVPLLMLPRLAILGFCRPTDSSSEYSIHMPCTYLYLLHIHIYRTTVFILLIFESSCCDPALAIRCKDLIIYDKRHPRSRHPPRGSAEAYRTYFPEARMLRSKGVLE